ncbi:MAG: hypothetical protein JRH20_12055 [Deltaproteobacteria bacterium]|nr:hypothetical protein [Deltaproteobacteria bacterium]
MSRSSHVLVLVASVTLIGLGCSDRLPALPDSGVEDGATHDTQAAPDGAQPTDLGAIDGTLPLDGSEGCFNNSVCPDTSYCQLDGCDGLGVCVGRPQECPAVEDPVCDCDGTTYSNGCIAASVGVNVRHAGTCTTSGCLSNGDCISDEFCNLDYHCSAAGELGQCEALPFGCPEVYAPVCGCDDNDYGNACEAHVTTTTMATPAKLTPRVCRCCTMERATLMLRRARPFKRDMPICLEKPSSVEARQVVSQSVPRRS